jgi:hypothetical protein
MSDGTLGFVALIAMLAANRLVLSLAGYGTWRSLFWSIQFLNLGSAIFLIVWGLPGLPRGLWLVNWFIALLFMWHIIENNGKRVKHLRARSTMDEGPEDSDLEAKRAALREKLHGGSDNSEA